MDEPRSESLGSSDYGKSLRMIVHGGPGTYMSHVMKLIRNELLGDVLKRDRGVPAAS